MPVDRVLLAEPRGFCAGVEKAIKALAWMVRVFEPPVYCYHEIVHNRHVVDQFVAQGVVFVDDVSEVPAGAPLMLSAHGSAPEVVDAARADGRVVVDAVCPLVTKVHHELKVRARKGYTVLYVGHHGHEEAVGTMAVAPEAVRLLEQRRGRRRARSAPADGARPPVALLAQTTLSHDEWAGIVAPGPASGSPTCGCPTGATSASPPPTARRRSRPWPADATPWWSSGRRTPPTRWPWTKVAAAFGCPRVVRVNDASELPDDLSGTVGVTAGASAPEALVEAVVARPGPDRGGRARRGHGRGGVLPAPARAARLLRGLEHGTRPAQRGPGRRPAPTRWATTGTAAADVLERRWPSDVLERAAADAPDGAAVQRFSARD